MTGPREGLSVVMIGRNEEAFLDLSLPPLVGTVDEIVFVDTGSTDRTLALAEARGCRIFRHDWADDFSAPKNFGIHQARCAWILNVDCDEALVVEPGTRDWIASHCLAARPEPAFIVTLDNLMADGSRVRQEALRLFRNDERIRFRNPVHESVCDAVYQHWPRQPPGRAELTLRHHGYRQGTNREKLRRNVHILRQWLQREPDTLFGNYKLGTNLLHLGGTGEGLFFLGRAFGLLCQVPDRISYPFADQLVTLYFQELLRAGRPDEARQVREIVAAWG
ncbi:MAG: glycosyltransferase [Magnetococcales bacterium]|nr:glycosyltransferase [Magnetococcales bacterium]